MKSVELEPTRCAICGTYGNAAEIYPANFDSQAFNPTVFSARRLPDRLHYRMVRCNTCGLVRSDPVASPAVLAQLYAQSRFEYAAQVDDLRLTYGRYLTHLDACGARKGSLLEIGGGNGFFLQEALAHGYSEVRGVEPSVAAVKSADPQVRDCIVCNIMRPGLFAPDHFDVICLFQVLDHISDPNALLAECRLMTKVGGLLLFIHHNVEAVSARLLGERSPIVDLEHTFLYSPATMGRLCRRHGFQVVRDGPVFNTYSLDYLLRLLPLPNGCKRFLLFVLQKSSLGRLRLRLPLGNLYFIARKLPRS